jgi:hypothetical protein
LSFQQSMVIFWLTTFLNAHEPKIVGILSKQNIAGSGK